MSSRRSAIPRSEVSFQPPYYPPAEDPSRKWGAGGPDPDDENDFEAPYPGEDTGTIDSTPPQSGAPSRALASTHGGAAAGAIPVVAPAIDRASESRFQAQLKKSLQSLAREQTKVVRLQLQVTDLERCGKPRRQPRHRPGGPGDEARRRAQRERAAGTPQSPRTQRARHQPGEAQK